MRSDTTRLDQLTSLRFFAALMVVIHHATEPFGIPALGVNLGQGVSFFFVLSGFILTYVYRVLNTWSDIGYFWRARVARIWPAYVASLALGFWLLNYPWEGTTLVPFLLMVQGWIPISQYYFSYNAVSWSVSTEFFFYLVFPALLFRWNETWPWKVLLSGALVIALALITSHFSLPRYVAPSNNDMTVTRHGLMYINPLARLFEFTIGMCIAILWQQTRRAVAWGRIQATVYEIGALMVCVLFIWAMPKWASWAARSMPGPSIAMWMNHSGSVLAFGLLIYIMALGRGQLSRWLAAPSLVLLGEISFAVYLIHQIFLGFYQRHMHELARIPDFLAFSLFMVLVLLSSYLMWAVVEMPARRWIMGRGTLHGTAVMVRSWRNHLALSRKPLLAAAALAVLAMSLRVVMRSGDAIAPEEALRLTPAELRQYAGTRFGNALTLRGLTVACQPDGLGVQLAWQHHRGPKEAWTVGIHLVDDNGDILGQADYGSQPPTGRHGAIRWDSLLIPEDRLSSDMTRLGILIYRQPGTLLPIDRGVRDWNDRRLLVPIPACAAPREGG